MIKSFVKQFFPVWALRMAQTRYREMKGWYYSRKCRGDAVLRVFAGYYARRRPLLCVIS